MIGLSCYILADTFFVAKALGSLGLAALNFSIVVFTFLQGIGLMIGMGGAIDFSICKGKDKDEANKTFVHSLVVGGICSIFFVIIGVFFTTPLSRVLGADATTLSLTRTYLSTILIFSPFFILNNIMLAFIRNDQNPKLSMIAMLISSFSNVILDYIFMFPLSMGIFGAAFATGLSPIISLCILSLHLKKDCSFRLCKCRISIKKIANMISLGFSSFVGELASSITLFTFNLIILGIAGNTGVAAYGIIANIAIIVTSIFTGVAQGIQPMTSEYYAKSDKKGIGSILRFSLLTGCILAVVIYLAILLFSNQIISLFNGEQNQTLAFIANEGIKIYFVGYFFAGINIIAASFFSAISNATKAMTISILRSSVMLIPIILIMSTVLKMNGVWLSFVITEFLVFLLTIMFLYRLKKVN